MDLDNQKYDHEPLLTEADREQLHNELLEALADLRSALQNREQTQLWWQSEQTRRHLLRQLIAGRRLRFIEEDVAQPFYLDPPTLAD